MGLKTPPLKVPAQVQGQMGLSVLKGLVPIKFHQGLTTILQVPNEALLHVLNLHHAVLTREAAGLLIVLLNPLVVDPDPEVVHHPILVQALAVVPVVPGLRLGTSDLYLSQKNIK